MNCQAALNEYIIHHVNSFVCSFRRTNGMHLSRMKMTSFGRHQIGIQSYNNNNNNNDDYSLVNEIFKNKLSIISQLILFAENPKIRKRKLSIASNLQLLENSQKGVYVDREIERKHLLRPERVTGGRLGSVAFLIPNGRVFLEF